MTPTAEEVSDRLWDVVVIGAGMAGSTLSHEVAKAGLSVLVCEKGIATGGAPVVAGYPESQTGGELTEEALLRAGRHAGLVIDESSRRSARRFLPFIGSGAGGSSALYGMALERFAPADFTPGRFHAGASGASSVEAWPVTHGELEPYYERAEALYRVRGTADPLGTAGRRYLPPPPLTPAAQSLYGHFERQGLHPYRLPMACEFVEGCNCCQGVQCGRACKNDSGRICLAPAVAKHGARLIDRCTAVRLEAEGDRVERVHVRWLGREIAVRARCVVLAAGALQTPGLLFRSSSSAWPDGLANRSGMVGRNLMRHFVDLYLVQPYRAERADLDNRFKEIGLNDFYLHEGRKLGTVQSFGRLPPKDVLLRAMSDDARSAGFPWLAKLVPLAGLALGPTLDTMVNRTIALATTVEDMPYPENRVISSGPDDRSIRMVYRISPYDRERISKMRSLMTVALKGRRFRVLKQSENNQRLAHACGTCRFGSDPTSSVLDANNKAHDLENLYVIDSSFFPSSGGTNPSLTIAANALRVAAHLVADRATTASGGHRG